MKIHPQILEALKDRALRTGLNADDLANKILSRALSMSVEGTTLEDQISFGINKQIDSLKGKTFTDAGARAYAAALRYEFQKQASIKGLDLQNALKQLIDIIIKYEGDVELISDILMGRHVLTGDEMVIAIRQAGNCQVHKMLQEWSGDPLHSLSKVFVDAIKI